LARIDPNVGDLVQQEHPQNSGGINARCRYKIQYVWKFKAASRASPCDSTAFLYYYAVENNNKFAV